MLGVGGDVEPSAERYGPFHIDLYQLRFTQ
jgi:hypothetical protein